MTLGISTNNRFQTIRLLCLATSLNISGVAIAAEPPRVAITQIVEHPSLDKIRKGILDELQAQGYAEPDTVKIEYDNAQGNITTAAQIAQKFASLNPAVIVAITTPSAQTVMAATKSTIIPVVFGAVTDPVGAGIVNNLEKPGAQVTGTIDLPSAEDQLELMINMLPNLKVLGVLYNPGEANNRKQVEIFKKAAEKRGIQVIEAHATKSSEVSQSAQSLAGKVEAVLLPNDNTVVSALESLLKIMDEAKIPVFASDPDSVERGAVAALANDQYLVGRETGKVVVRVLKGETPGEIPVQIVRGSETYFNEAKLNKLGLKKPSE